MNDIKKHIKRIKYNNVPEFLICMVLLVIDIIAMLLIPRDIMKDIVLVPLLLIILIYILVKIREININIYFKLTKSYLTKSIFINQKSIIKSNKVECPLKDFIRELYDMKDKLIQNQTYICCTHSTILKQINKYFTVLEIEEVKHMRMKLIRKKLMNHNCKSCKKKCLLKKDKQVQFYAVKFK